MPIWPGDKPDREHRSAHLARLSPGKPARRAVAEILVHAKPEVDAVLSHEPDERAKQREPDCLMRIHFRSTEQALWYQLQLQENATAATNTHMMTQPMSMARIASIAPSFSNQIVQGWDTLGGDWAISSKGIPFRALPPQYSIAPFQHRAHIKPFLVRRIAIFFGIPALTVAVSYFQKEVGRQAPLLHRLAVDAAAIFQ